MTDRELARRYLWFINTGYKYPVLNDPKVILGEATPDYIDTLIQNGMVNWPTKLNSNQSQLPPTPKAA